MASDKAAYLARHYLSTDSKPASSKKRKRKQTAATPGLLITDDDDKGWGSTRPADADADDDTPVTIAGTTADFRRTKKSGWKPITSTPASASTSAATSTPTAAAATASRTAAAADDDATADAIIASAAADSRALAADADDEPPDDPSVPQMSNGTLAGLQSASSLTAQLRRRQQAEAAELAELRAAQRAKEQQQQEGEGGADDGDEIILRDATGRRIDASMRRAEARRAQAEAERRERAKAELLRGEVQAAEARARRERLEEAALMPVARGRDDAELNEELKRTERWHDPMAEFLGAGGDGPSGPGAGRKKAGRRPVYKGAAAPNRYGIRPGYRWDGVDRGNGFEAERFKALNRRERDKGLEYAWQMDE